MKDRFPWGSVIVFIVCAIIAIVLMVNKSENCKQAGWEYHRATEQCLPKKVNNG